MIGFLMYSVILKQKPDSWVLGLNQWPRIMFGLTGGFFLLVFLITPGKPILSLLFGIMSFISAGYWEAWIFHDKAQPKMVSLILGIWPFVSKKSYPLEELFRVEVQIPRGRVFATLASSAKNLGQEFLGAKLDRRVIQIFLVFKNEQKPLRILTESTKDYPRIQQMAQDLATYLKVDFLVREV
jgi:hypothetical protein